MYPDCCQCISYIFILHSQFRVLYCKRFHVKRRWRRQKLSFNFDFATTMEILFRILIKNLSIYFSNSLYVPFSHDVTKTVHLQTSVKRMNSTDLYKSQDDSLPGLKKSRYWIQDSQRCFPIPQCKHTAHHCSLNLRRHPTRHWGHWRRYLHQLWEKYWPENQVRLTATELEPHFHLLPCFHK